MLDYKSDISTLKKKLKNLPTIWAGKECILELKEANYNWKQMEWCGFYFEYKSKSILKNLLNIPGKRYGNVEFDLRGKINWDLKASAIKTDKHLIILNAK